MEMDSRNSRSELEGGLPEPPGESPEPEELVSLNLVTTYPVHWSRFQVLRDFLQNFFDAVPNDEFAKRVSVRVSGRTAELRAEGVTFSHEWLIPIGASSKTTDTRGSYAGYFGEGFKVAALCAHRDFGWRITAGSGCWSLEVTTTPFVVDGTQLSALAYRVRRTVPESSAAWLRLELLRRDDLAMLKTAVLWSFYYPGNPLLGELLWCDARTAVWTRSTTPTPDSYPGNARDRGILFVGRQARGTHELPFVLAAHDVRDSDRERNTYYDFQVVDTIATIARRLPARPSMPLLQATSRHWGDYRKRRYECGTWEPIVRSLAANLARDPELVAQWREQYPDLLVVEPVARGSMRMRNERSEARAWERTSDRDWWLVQSGFRVLGYPTLEDECRRQGGFLRRVEPLPEEHRRIRLLLAFVRAHFMDLFPLDSWPRLVLVDARRAGWSGMAMCHPLRGGALSSRGRRVRHRLEEVSLSCDSVRSPSPQRALATLLHELCHAFGTEGAAAFPGALTDVLERTSALTTPLQELASDWSDGIR